MIALASDHGGYGLKTIIAKYLFDKNIPFKDYGTHNTTSVDYPLYADLAVNAVLSKECDRGILICTTGIGISIAANRHAGIRAAHCTDTYQARMTRLHNDANVLCLGAAVTGTGLALMITDTFLDTPFSCEEKHQRRVEMLG